MNQNHFTTDTLRKKGAHYTILLAMAHNIFKLHSQTSHITNTVHMRPAKGFRGNKKA